MNSFDKLSPEAIEALSGAQSEAGELLGRVVTNEANERETSRYANLAIDRHKQMQDIVSKYLAKGILPGDIEFPEIGTFEKELEDLEPTFHVMQELGWEPEVIFVPEGGAFAHDLSTWDQMLMGHVLKDGEISHGTNGNFYLLRDLLEKPEERIHPKWDVGVIAAQPENKVTNFSPNGITGKTQPHETIEAVTSLLKIKGYSADIIKKLSPSIDAYFTLQLTLLQRGYEPVDQEISTIGKENYKSKDAEILSSNIMLWGARERKVYCTRINNDKYDWNIGIRPTIMASELNATPDNLKSKPKNSSTSSRGIEN